MPVVQATIVTGAEPEAERVAALLSARLGEEVPVAWSETASGWTVAAYFEDGTVELARRAVADALGGDAFGLDVRVEELPETDWVAKSLEGLPPVRAGRFLVHGSHDRDKRRASDVAVEIEAGQAFGTGHHGTTAGCLLALERTFEQRRFRNGLDLGTGSGVLAIAIARRWRTPMLATDIDPVATVVATENARLNGVAALVETVTAAGFGHLAFRRLGPFDLIVANILAGPLAAMATDLAGHLAPGGMAVLSGLLPSQQTRIVAAYRSRGLALVRASVREGWLTLILRSRAPRV